MRNSCISSVEITLIYVRVIDLTASILKKYRVFSQYRGPKRVQKGVNEASRLLTKYIPEISKIDIHCANATFRMRNF